MDNHRIYFSGWIKLAAAVVVALFGAVLSLVLYQDAYVTALVHYHPASSVHLPSNRELLKGEAIRGEVTAAYDNLGTISMRVHTFNRTNYDIIVFRMREKGAADWSVFNKYFTDRFPNNELYPFGFPVIAESRGKKYEFEIFAVNGKPGDAVGFSNGYHSVATQYVYSKSFLRQPKNLKWFVSNKILNFATDLYFILYEIQFLIPALLLVAGPKRRIFGFGTLAYLLLAYLFLPVSMSSNGILYVFAVTLAISAGWSISPGILFAVSAVMITSIPVFLLFGQETFANRISRIVYFILVAALLRMAFRFTLKGRSI